ncbi:electron transport complex protein RnfG [Cedecea neteri]|uniref:Electron transport complex protein RnfG n=1 Tax=Cedecea neteri TaxID=158822 RepID=A0A2X3ILG1_9ENTR|nr:electron transport complex protein RnfG [Cedecea neteri]
MFKTMQKHGVALALFAALFTGLTALVNELTKPTIAQQSALQQKMLFDQVIADDVYDNPIQDSCLLVKDSLSVKAPGIFTWRVKAISRLPW